MAMTRDEILTRDDYRVREVQVPEWGGSVFVRTMSSRDRDRFEADAVAARGGVVDRIDNWRARLVVRTACDDKGALLFASDDAQKLGEKSAAAVNRLFSVAMELNNVTADDIEELEKN